jgi:hypothetical protein
MSNPYRAFRQLERRIFRGVPEQPESVWQREPNAYVPERLTGMSQLGRPLPLDPLAGATVAGTLVYSFEKKSVRFVADRKTVE